MRQSYAPLTLCAAVALSVGFVGPGRPQGSASSIEACRSTQDLGDRLDCYDRFMPKRQAQGRKPSSLRDCSAVGDEEARLACYEDRKSTRLNSSHANISYAVF